MKSTPDTIPQQYTLEIISYTWGILSHPVKTINHLLQEEKKVTYGILFILLFSSSYTVYTAVLYLAGEVPYYWEPFLRIPLEKWYLWQTFTTIPVTISTWILLAGCIQLLSSLFNSTGSFEDTLAVLALPMVILIPAMLIPDIFVDFLLPEEIVYSPLFWNFINPLRLILASLWVVIIHILAVKEAQSLSFSQTFMVIAVSYIPYMFFNLTFIH